MCSRKVREIHTIKDVDVGKVAFQGGNGRSGCQLTNDQGQLVGRSRKSAYAVSLNSSRAGIQVCSHVATKLMDNMSTRPILHFQGFQLSVFANREQGCDCKNLPYRTRQILWVIGKSYCALSVKTRHAVGALFIFLLYSVIYGLVISLMSMS
jgi:hypothetical protein